MEDVFRVLSDAVRRRILQRLAAGECTQSDLVGMFDISQPAVVKHLKVLKRAGLIRERREGRYCYYSTDEAALRDAYRRIREEMEAMMDQRLRRLKDFVERGKDGRPADHEEGNG